MICIVNFFFQLLEHLTTHNDAIGGEPKNLAA